MKKLILTLAITLLAFSLIGCGNKSTPEKTVSQFLDASKQLDLKTMATHVKGTALDDFEGITNETSPVDFFKSLTAKMTYEVKNVEEKDDSATVTVEIKSVDATDMILEVVQAYLKESLTKALSGKPLTDEENTALLTSLFEEKQKTSEEVIVTNTLDIKCVKEEDTWYISGLDNEFLNIISSSFAQLQETISSFFGSTDKE